MKVLVLGVASVQMDAVVELKKFGCETYTIAMAKDGPAADVADHFDIINIFSHHTIALSKQCLSLCYKLGIHLF